MTIALQRAILPNMECDFGGIVGLPASIQLLPGHLMAKAYPRHATRLQRQLARSESGAGRQLGARPSLASGKLPTDIRIARRKNTS